MSNPNPILSSVARNGLTWLGRRRLAQTSGSFTLPGVEQAVEILRDRWGIPHIYAANARDLFYAQGFVHAQDRLFQMEINRRTGQGRLSELFGELALDTDRTIRTFGFNRLGAADWERAAPDLREAILAYSAGINAYLKHPRCKLPVEFTLLNYKPEPWQPEDTTSFARVMIWQLSHAWYGEIIRARLAGAVGPEKAADWEVHYPQQNPLTLPLGIEFNRLTLDGLLQPGAGPFLQRGQGSNAWAVSAAKSESGGAYLCNDMHLAMGIPCLWYGIHLVGGGLNVTGVSLPGAPLILVGHNAHIAWGMTLAYTDCEDLFIEEFDPQDAQRYRTPDGWQPAEIIEESIRVKGRSHRHVESVVVTRHGPIISGVVGAPEQRLAVCSKALQPGPSFSGWLRLNQAQGWDDYVEAMRLIEAPQLNVAYADTGGNIGYWVTGKVPIRGKGNGSLPAPGWSGEYDWTGEVPFESMPHALNPRQGYLVTCNHRIVPDDYPYFLGNVWMNGYRPRRIVDVFESKPRLSRDDFHALHLDYTTFAGREFVAALAGFESTQPDVRQALEQLRTWDGVLSPDSAGGAIYEVTRYTLVRGLLEPVLGTELALQVLGNGFHPLLLAAHEFYGHDTVSLLRMLEDPKSWWVEQAGGRQALIERGLRQATVWLRQNLGPNLQDWQWGKLHRAIFPHPLGVQKPLDLVFNRGPFPIGGDTDTPCQTGFHSSDPYDNKAWAPTYRQIIDMSDFTTAEFIFPPGESGQLGSPHYDDAIQPWLTGQYRPMLWTRAQVEANLEGRLVLEAEK